MRMLPGTGQFELNGRTLEDYFPNKVHQQLVKAPLVTVERTESFDIVRSAARRRTVRSGRRAASGYRACADRGHPDDRPALKRAGFLTRDPRATERKKYGLKKARKAPQYSKR